MRRQFPHVDVPLPCNSSSIVLPHSVHVESSRGSGFGFGEAFSGVGLGVRIVPPRFPLVLLPFAPVPLPRPNSDPVPASDSMLSDTVGDMDSPPTSGGLSFPFFSHVGSRSSTE